MHNLKSVAIAAVTCVLVAGSLSAQTATGKVKWVGVNGAWSKYSNNTSSTQWSVYTSPYRAQFWINNPGSFVVPPSPLLPPAGTNAFGPTSDIFCVDFNHSANTGTYNANFTNLGSNATDVGTKTRSGVGLTKYLEAAWLSQKIKEFGVSSDSAKDMNGAIWQIISGSPKYRYNGTSWTSAGINSWMSQAAANYGSVNASDWVVVTDVLSAGNQTGGSQEYITQVTPEPATLILLGTGLLGLLLASGAIRRPMA